MHILKYSRDKGSIALYNHRLGRDKAHHYGKGRKSSPCLVLESLESDAKVQDIIGKAQRGRQGLGLNSKKKKALRDPNQERRRQLGLIMRRDAESKRLLLLHNY